MNLIYSKKENPYLYFVLALLVLGAFIAGIYFVNYYLWYILAPVVLLTVKGFNILKKEEIPVIKLNDDGLTVLKENQENIIYAYSDISEIKMNSNLFNGFIRIKNYSKKIHLDSVAIPLSKQAEIENMVNARKLKQ